jgi:hypothetical protein
METFARSVRVGVVVCAALTAVAIGARVARAADPAADAALKEATAKVDELDKQIKKHLAVTTADDALRADITAASKLTTELADPKLKARCLDLIGAILKGTTHDDLEKDAIKAFGTIGNPDAGKWILPYLKQEDPKSQPPLLGDAIECSAKIKSDATVPALIAIVEKSDVLPLAASAIKALANFGASVRTRQSILDALVATVEKDRPGLSYKWRGGQDDRYKTGKIRSGEDARTRYEALAGEMCTALNKLTGQNVAAPEDWFDLRKKWKSDLGHLFVN